MPRTFNEFVESINKQREDKIRQLENNPSISFFFKKNKEIFAGPEDSRLAFARLKNPDEEDENWDGDFLGINVADAIGGDAGEHLFNKKDLEHIKVMDKDEVFKILRKK